MPASNGNGKSFRWLMGALFSALILAVGSLAGRYITDRDLRDKENAVKNEQQDRDVSEIKQQLARIEAQHAQMIINQHELRADFQDLRKAVLQRQ